MKKTTNSDRIRLLKEKNPALTNTQIAAQLEKDGYKVSQSQISQVLKAKKVSKTKSPGRPKGSKNAAKVTKEKPGPKPGSVRVKAVTNAASTDQDLFASMQNFVNTAGSLEKAIEILSVFKR